MRNIEMTVDDQNILTIKIDLSKEFGLSSSEEHMERSVVRRAPRSREGRTFCRCPQPYRGLRQNVRQPSTA